jgi:hypothetical protein
MIFGGRKGVGSVELIEKLRPRLRIAENAQPRQNDAEARVYLLNAGRHVVLSNNERKGRRAS